MSKLTIDVRDAFNEWFETMSLEKLQSIKEKATQMDIERGNKPGLISNLFNSIIDAHIDSKTAESEIAAGSMNL